MPTEKAIYLNMFTEKLISWSGAWPVFGKGK